MGFGFLTIKLKFSKENNQYCKVHGGTSVSFCIHSHLKSHHSTDSHCLPCWTLGIQHKRHVTLWTINRYLSNKYHFQFNVFYLLPLFLTFPAALCLENSSLPTFSPSVSLQVFAPSPHLTAGHYALWCWYLELCCSWAPTVCTYDICFNFQTVHTIRYV